MEQNVVRRMNEEQTKGFPLHYVTLSLLLPAAVESSDQIFLNFAYDVIIPNIIITKSTVQST